MNYVRIVHKNDYVFFHDGFVIFCIFIRKWGKKHKRKKLHRAKAFSARIIYTWNTIYYQSVQEFHTIFFFWEYDEHNARWWDVIIVLCSFFSFFRVNIVWLSNRDIFTQFSLRTKELFSSCGLGFLSFTIWCTRIRFRSIRSFTPLMRTFQQQQQSALRAFG